MGNRTAKRVPLTNDDDDVQKTKRFSTIRRISHDIRGKDKDFDITEKEFQELRDISRSASVTPYYPVYCLTR